MERKLRVGVIGLGIGKAHIRSYKNHPECEVVAVADIDKDKLEKVKAEYHIPALYTSTLEMFKREKLDLVSVAVPNRFHKDLSIQAFEAGCHVLCEKPMALNAKEAEEMIMAAKKKKRRLMINFSFRFVPSSWLLKNEIDSGIIGKIYYGKTSWLRRKGIPKFGGWFTNKEFSGGGPVIDLGVHRIDLALWLMNFPEVEWVSARTYDFLGRMYAKEQKKNFDVEDLGCGFIIFKNGSSLHFEASWASFIKEQEYMQTFLMGTKGGAVQKNKNEGYEFEAEIYIERNGQRYTLIPAGKIDSAPASSMEYFVDCIINNKSHIATGEEGLYIMRILDAIYKSAEIKKPVKF